MKTVVIPDLHNRVYWVEDFLLSIPYDKVIFLGDYFDNYNDTYEDIVRSAEWLKKSLYKPNRIHLMGTHDVWYRFPYNLFVMASGNSSEKEEIINNILEEKEWSLLKLYYFEQNFLVTHAGVHPFLISEYISRNHKLFRKHIINNHLQLGNTDIINKIIEPATKEALIDLSKGDSNSWLEAGEARKGDQPIGGITWLDWNIEFVPIPGLNQIVGHTELLIPEERSTNDSKNYCIDTRNHYIGIIENGKFTFIENPYIK